MKIDKQFNEIPQNTTGCYRQCVLQFWTVMHSEDSTFQRLPDGCTLFQDAETADQLLHESNQRYESFEQFRKIAPTDQSSIRWATRQQQSFISIPLRLDYLFKNGELYLPFDDLNSVVAFLNRAISRIPLIVAESNDGVFMAMTPAGDCCASFSNYEDAAKVSTMMNNIRRELFELKESPRK